MKQYVCNDYICYYLDRKPIENYQHIMKTKDIQTLQLPSLPSRTTGWPKITYDFELNMIYLKVSLSNFKIIWTSAQSYCSVKSFSFFLVCAEMLLVIKLQRRSLLSVNKVSDMQQGFESKNMTFSYLAESEMKPNMNSNVPSQQYFKNIRMDLHWVHSELHLNYYC